MDSKTSDLGGKTQWGPFLEHQVTWHTRLSQRTLRFKTEHFKSDFIATCSIPSLQCFDSWEDFGCSYGTVFSSVKWTSCVSDGIIVTGL